MLKQSFKDKIDFDFYVAEQKVRMEKGYLTFSERNQLKTMLEKNYKPVFIKEEKSKPPLITNINELRKLCELVKEGEDISQILKDLKETCIVYNGLGLTANQIGINKRISYLRIPFYNEKSKKMEFKETYLINAKITEKSNPIKVEGEQCLSFPGISVITKRYVFCTVVAEDENGKKITYLMQDLEGLTAQHEIDHQNSLTIIDKKWKVQ